MYLYVFILCRIIETSSPTSTRTFISLASPWNGDWWASYHPIAWGISEERVHPWWTWKSMEISWSVNCSCCNVLGDQCLRMLNCGCFGQGHSRCPREGCVAMTAIPDTFVHSSCPQVEDGLQMSRWTTGMPRWLIWWSLTNGACHSMLHTWRNPAATRPWLEQANPAYSSTQRRTSDVTQSPWAMTTDWSVSNKSTVVPAASNTAS